ncbi:MAG: hypothetical protein LBD11_02310 [Candidatus Peribacteria bacterium]|jgi:hypothetical protein|nr:hypothetical protein [Candidatus Peribacteria bacterium]
MNYTKKPLLEELSANYPQFGPRFAGISFVEGKNRKKQFLTEMWESQMETHTRWEYLDIVEDFKKNLLNVIDFSPLISA